MNMPLSRLNDHLKLTRPGRWIKNAAIFPGALMAWQISKTQVGWDSFFCLALAFLSVLLLSCGNYTINELLDAGGDSRHPVGRLRPVPSGKITAWAAYMQWFLLALAGLILAWLLNRAFFAAALMFFFMGLVYNVRPFRAKDVAYFDVLTESLNSPLRFLLGWYAMKCYLFPPLSLLISLWMLAAFFVSVKRIAELRFINDPQVAAAYRRPFSYYNQERLVSGAVFYAAAFGVLMGIFSAIYRLELVLALPFMGGLLAAYMQEGLKKDSIIRCPERLYQRKFLMGYFLVTLIVIFSCFNVRLPWLANFLR
jgi:4-hydroxybenzoate polyprenyltransferase